MADMKKTLLSIQQVLFFTTFTTSVALLLLVPLAAGMLLGWVGGRLRASKKAKKAAKEIGEGPAALPAGEDTVEDVDWENLDLDKIEV
jgi:hypothetical protein